MSVKPKMKTVCFVMGRSSLGCVARSPCKESCSFVIPLLAVSKEGDGANGEKDKPEFRPASWIELRQMRVT